MKKRNNYVISINTPDGLWRFVQTIRHGSPDEAATAYARTAYGRRAVAWRLTGTNGLSGQFQAYLPAPKPYAGLLAEGDPFFVL